MKPLLRLFSLLVALASVAKAQTPGVLREVWDNLDGTSIVSLTASPNFPGAPVLRVVDPSFQAPVNWADRYGVRMRAWLSPAATSSYTFWISGDDNCELWLSTDETPANRVRIATVSSWTAAQVWNAYAEQRSAPVSLQAGKRYYIEALMKEGSGGDSLSVAWAVSPTDTPQVIPGANLTPYEVPATIQTGLVVKAGKPLTQYAPNLMLNVSAQALDLAHPSQFPSIKWTQVAGAAAVIGTPQAANSRIDVPAAGSYTFRATATSGSLTAMDDLVVTIAPSLAPDAGSALSEYWFGVSGSTVASLANSLDYPSFPHAHRVVTSLTSSQNLGDEYGERTRGFLLVPATGSYRFYTAADEAMEFYLSTDASTANLQLRASVAKAVAAGDYFANASQSSAPVQLTAGQRYAFEIRHKEEWGADHCSVLWQQPGTDYLTDITGEFLAPPADAAPVVIGTQAFDLDSDYVLNAGRDRVIYLPQNAVSFSAYETRRYWAADTPVRSWTQVNGPAGVKLSSPALAACAATFPGVGTYVLRYSVKTLRNTSADDVRVEVRAPINASTGQLTRQVWWNRNYATIDALRADAAFPDNPDIVDNIPELRQTNDWGSLYGTRVTGILNVQAGGTALVNYTFYVSGDDAAEFSISTDATAANLARVCYATKPGGRENWSSEPSQISAPVALKPGGRYFVQLLHKETYGSDNFAVAWSREGDRQPSVIDGSYFEPAQKVAAFDANMNYYASAGRNRTYYWPHDRTNLLGALIKAHDTPNTPVASWHQLSGPKAVIANAADLGTAVVFSGVGSYLFELTVTEGVFTHRDSVTIAITSQQTAVAGSLTRSVWFDVNGSALADLYAYDATLSFPHFEDLLPGAEPPMNWADYYGTRLKGYLTVPITGSYTLWISADESAELKFDGLDGKGLQRIAYLSNAVSPHDWDRNASQKSAVFALTAGTRYPLEAVQKEGTGNDHLSLALSGPATNGREVLSRGFLSPFKPAAAFNPEITVALGVNRTILWPANQVTLAALVYDLKPGPKALAYQWSSTSAKVSFDNATSAVSTVKFAAAGVYEVKMTATDGLNTASGTVLVTVQNPLSSTAGGILREVWTGVPGYTLNDLRNSAAYAGKPTFKDVLSSFEAPSNWGDNYGQRLTGFLQVPADGDYVFLVSSDDESELWMNTAGEPAAGATKIAYAPSASGEYNWTRFASQQSASIHLLAGKRYFVQAFHKEGNNDDNLAVAYRRADQPNSAAVIVPGVLLSPPSGATTAAFDGQINVKAGDNQSAVWPHKRFTLHGIAIDYVPGPQALVYRWSVVSAPAGMAAKVLFDAPTALTTGIEFPAAGTYKLQLTATDGLSTRSDSLTITIGAQLAAGTGSILCETYKNITGSWVTDLVKSPKFPNSPDDRVRLTSTEIPSNQGDNYGLLIRGYVHAASTGIYRFNIASDDWSEAYISPDKKPENKEMICFVPAGTDYYEWRKYPDYQLSRPIKLTGGQSYYLEIRFKESTWRDHLALAWLKPGSASFEIIDGAYLSPWILPDAQPPVITLTGGSDVTLNVGSAYVDPGFSATDLVDGNVAANVTTSGSVDASTPGTYLVRYTVKDSSGNDATVTRKVTVAVAAGQAPVYPADTSGTYSTAAWVAPAVISDQDAARFLKQA
ncbi:MAG: C-terminal target protein, partial [Verrucomicrobiaceae bacterium]|nr:C-terminal target protein [Verrucomicrobiaceae bacterium]